MGSLPGQWQHPHPVLVVPTDIACDLPSHSKQLGHQMQKKDEATYLGFPRRAAWCRALNPLLLVMVTSAPDSSNTDSMSSLFLLMASCSGVSPSESYKQNNRCSSFITNICIHQSVTQGTHCCPTDTYCWSCSAGATNTVAQPVKLRLTFYFIQPGSVIVDY